MPSKTFSGKKKEVGAILSRGSIARRNTLIGKCLSRTNLSGKYHCAKISRKCPRIFTFKFYFQTNTKKSTQVFEDFDLYFGFYLFAAFILFHYFFFSFTPINAKKAKQIFI